MLQYSLYDASCIFFLYGAIGWCVEVIYAAVNRGTFVNRGFLLGPICPIYGLGTLAVLIALWPLKENLLVLYLGSVAITTALELAVGVLARALFHERLWDYSLQPFNFKGYICLKFSLRWGLGAVMVVDILHPMLWKLVSAVPRPAGMGILGALYAVLLVDLALTLVESLKIPRRIRAVRELERLLNALSSEIGEGLAGNTLRMRDRKDELGEKLARYRELFDHRARSLTDRRLFKAFPHLQKGRYWERFERIRDQYFGRRGKPNDEDDQKGA